MDLRLKRVKVCIFWGGSVTIDRDWPRLPRLQASPIAPFDSPHRS